MVTAQNVEANHLLLGDTSHTVLQHGDPPHQDMKRSGPQCKKGCTYLCFFKVDLLFCNCYC